MLLDMRSRYCGTILLLIHGTPLDYVSLYPFLPEEGLHVPLVQINKWHPPPLSLYQSL